MRKVLRDVMASAQKCQFPSERAANAWLDQQGLSDPTERIGLKHFWASTGQLGAGGRRLRANLATDQDDQPRGRLATDTASRPWSANHLQRLMDRAGIRPMQSYDERDVDALLKAADITDIETRMAVKTELRQRG